jgi:hypothetical protein
VTHTARDAILLPLRLAALAAMVALRRASRRLGRALDVPCHATIVRPDVTRWAVEMRPSEDGYPPLHTLHHDDMAQLSDVTVYAPLRWGPVVLVHVWGPAGEDDVWVLRASGELVTAEGREALKSDREVLETIRHEQWAAEMAQ